MGIVCEWMGLFVESIMNKHGLVKQYKIINCLNKKFMILFLAVLLVKRGIFKILISLIFTSTRVASVYNLNIFGKFLFFLTYPALAVLLENIKKIPEGDLWLRIELML